MIFLKQAILFILSFLLATEIFLFFNINTGWYTIIPTAIAFALLSLMLKQPFIHLYKLAFQDGYKEDYKQMRKQRGRLKHKHHSHNGRHRSNRHHGDKHERQLI